jgi:hypothetical protein
VRALVRLLRTQPALVGSTASAVYAAGVMLYRAYVEHTGVFDADVLVAAVLAAWGAWTYLQVTPLERPRDAKGRSLHPVSRR